jgi:hypothetical protein
MTRWLAGVESDRGSLPLWAGWMGSPMLWATHLVLGYMLVPWLCTTHRAWVAHVVTVAFAAGSGSCVYFCWRVWRDVGGGMPSSSEAPALGRTRFAAVVGIMSGALFTLLILAQHLGHFFLSPCWD